MLIYCMKCEAENDEDREHCCACGNALKGWSPIREEMQQEEDRKIAKRKQQRQAERQREQARCANVQQDIGYLALSGYILWWIGLAGCAAAFLYAGLANRDDAGILFIISVGNWIVLWIVGLGLKAIAGIWGAVERMAEQGED